MTRIPADQLGIDLADLVHDLHVFAFNRRDEELWVEVANKRQLSKTTQGYAWLLEEVADEAKLARRDLARVAGTYRIYSRGRRTGISGGDFAGKRVGVGYVWIAAHA